MNKTYKLYTDGCYYPDYKIAGYGGYILDSKGSVVVNFSEVIDNPRFFTMHESLGIKRGLELCLEHNIKNVECYTDEQSLSMLSNLPEQQLLSKYEKIPALKDIVFLREQFESVNFNYIPREKNKKADILSKKAALLHNNVKDFKNNKIQLAITNNLLSKQLDFTSNYKNKELFMRNHKDITDYIVINTSFGNEFITSFYVSKDLENNKMDVQVINKIKTKANNLSDILMQLTLVLQNVPHIENCIIFCHGGKSKDLEDIFRNKTTIPKNLEGLYQKYQLALNNFKKITYHMDNDVIAATIGSIKKIDTDTLQEKLFEAMKELGQQDYVLGKNKAIENLILMKDSKKEDKHEIQKAYFGEFLKLHIKTITQSKNLPIVKRELIEQKIIEMREKLTNQGVNFKMESTL